MTFRIPLLFLFNLTICCNLLGQSIISEITISGNDRTKDFVILRELVIHQDSTYSKDTLLQLVDISENRVMNLNLFNSVDITTHDIPDSETVKVHIQVVEKWYTWPMPFTRV